MIMVEDYLCITFALHRYGLPPSCFFSQPSVPVRILRRPLYTSGDKRSRGATCEHRHRVIMHGLTGHP